MPVPSGLELLPTFVVVAEELSFSRSAERLNINQSALSRRIQKLEQLLGFPLFERTTRDVSLTPAGRSFYEKGTQLLQNYTKSIDAARHVAEGKTGRLRIAYMAFAGLRLMPQAVARYREKFPYVAIHTRKLGTQDQKLAMANDELDIGYIIGPFHHSDFRTLVVKTDPLYAVMPTGHPLTEKSEIDPADLADTHLILGDRIKWETYRRRIEDLFKKQGVVLQVPFEASDMIAAMGFLSAGLGVAIYPKSLADFLGPLFEARPIKHPDFLIQLLLVWRSSDRNKALLNFVEIAKSVYP